MFTQAENEKLTRVERGAPMGELVRRFWLPFLLSSDLPTTDCVPVTVKLLGEPLVAFRDSDGKVGLLDQHCAHRRANLFFGRNEESGLRCTYHGWKYDVVGKCVDAPTEPRDSDFVGKIQLKAYPVAEKGGILWTYMGPRGRMAELPDFEWMHVPEGHVFTSWNTQESNFAQAIEGGIDTVHSVYLHSTLDSHRNLGARKAQGEQQEGAQQRFRTRDNPPKLFAKDTDYGVLVGGRYLGNEGTDYWRYNLFHMPFYTMPPGRSGQKSCHAFVPVDDVTTARWTISWTLEKPFPAREIAEMRAGSGVHAALIPGTHDPLRNKSNHYLIDREEQRTLTFTGIKGIGAIVDRSEEHLGVTDVGIIQLRRRLLKEATNLLEVRRTVCPFHGEVYRVHAGDSLLPADVLDWAEDPKTNEALAAKW